MNDDLHNIDDLFKKALEEYTEIPSSAVWDNIDKGIDKSKVVSIAKKYNKLKWAAAVLLLVSIGMAMYTISIRIKNKELVKRHNAGKNLENQKPSAKNDTEDFGNLANKNSTAIEKAMGGKELKKQESNRDGALNSSNKSNLPKDKNTADILSRGNQQVQPDPVIKSPSDGGISDYTAKQNQKQVLLKNKSPVTTREKFSLPDPVNNRKKNHVELPAPDNDKNVTTDEELQGRPGIKLVSTKEKYTGGVPVISQLRNRLETLATKPVSQGVAAPTNTNNSTAFTEHRIFPKHKNIAYTQQRNMKNTGNRLLSATIFFSPDLVSTNVENDHPLFRDEERHEIEKDEKIKSSYTTGVLIDYNAGKNWRLESGITFSTRFTDIDPKTIYARPDNNGNINYRFNCSAGYSYVTLKSSAPQPAYGDSIKALTSENLLQYIGVPLVVKYSFNKGKLGLTPGLGISANFLSRGKIETTLPTATGNEKVTSNDIQGLKSAYFNGIASMGVQYKLNRVLELTFIPTVSFALTSINKDAPVKTYLNSIGFSTGIIIKF